VSARLTPEERARSIAWEHPGTSGIPYNYRVHPDLMPRTIEVKKSSVELVVAGKLWGDAK
jgi:hypothetical protein